VLRRDQEVSLAKRRMKMARVKRVMTIVNVNSVLMLNNSYCDVCNACDNDSAQ
jgi:hypothetical protein